MSDRRGFIFAVEVESQIVAILSDHEISEMSLEMRRDGCHSVIEKIIILGMLAHESCENGLW